MIILLEGPDGVGKTSLGQAFANSFIANKHTCFYFHCTNKSARKSAEEDYTQLLQDLTNWKNLGYDIIIDRAWISNIVYTSVYEPEKAHVSNELVRKLFEIVDKVVICLPENKKDYLANFNKLAKMRKEDYIESVDKVYELFNTFAKIYTRYDILKDHKNKTDEFVKNVLEEAEFWQTNQNL